MINLIHAIPFFIFTASINVLFAYVACGRSKEELSKSLNSLHSFVTVVLSDFWEAISLFTTVSLAKICGPGQHNIISGLCCLRHGLSEIIAMVWRYLYAFCFSVLKAS